VTGFWYLNRSARWDPPADLAAFIRSGPAPVSVGFGSMVDQARDELTEITLSALESLGQRAVLLTGWGGLQDAGLPDWACAVEAVPYDWLFPQMAAVVHQGGAGTTAEGLRAGVPNVIVPFFADQFVWGERIAAIGAGPEAIPREELTGDKLARAIDAAVTDPAIRARAAGLATRIRAERGVERAVECFERHMAGA
jgi:UDP:flavonoid glycosyltransferase YjiC (YdhE family)